MSKKWEKLTNLILKAFREINPEQNNFITPENLVAIHWNFVPEYQISLGIIRNYI